MSEVSAFDRCRSKISEYFEKYGMKETLEAFNKECKQKASRKADSEKKNGRKRRKNDDVIDEVLDITDGKYSLRFISFFHTHINKIYLSLYPSVSLSFKLKIFDTTTNPYDEKFNAIISELYSGHHTITKRKDTTFDTSLLRSIRETSRFRLVLVGYVQKGDSLDLFSGVCVRLQTAD